MAGESKQKGAAMDELEESLVDEDINRVTPEEFGSCDLGEEEGE